MAFDNYIYGDEDPNFIVGSNDNDSIFGYGGDDHLDGGSGNDWLRGGDGSDYLLGGDGDDFLIAGFGIDTLIGGAGNDYYYFYDNLSTVAEGENGGLDRVITNIDYTLPENVEELELQGIEGRTGTGNDLNNVMFGSSGADTLFGGAGNDFWINGGEGNDTLYGGEGFDLLFGNAGDDLLIGGPGYDTYLYVDESDTIVELPGEGMDGVQATGSFVLPDNVENLTLLGNGDIDGTGNALDNNIASGSAGDNILKGLNGDDHLQAKGGSDVLIGGAGNDWYSLEDAGPHTVIEDPDEGIDGVGSAVTYTLPDNVERLMLGGYDDTDGTGNELDNWVWGYNGDNRLYGMEGDDSVLGFYGDDVLDGGAGNDILGGGWGNDLLIHDPEDRLAVNGGNGIDTLVISGSGQVCDLGAFESFPFANIESIDLTGTGDNTVVLGYYEVLGLTPETGAVVVKGDAGDLARINEVWVQGGTMELGGIQYSEFTCNNARVLIQEGVQVEWFSSPMIHGTNGDDVLAGGEADESIQGKGGEDQANGGGGDDYIAGGRGTDRLDGAKGNDLITGGSGNDVLRGREGDDILNGGSGNDVLNGGVGSDIYVVLAGDGTDSYHDTGQQPESSPGLAARFDAQQAAAANDVDRLNASRVSMLHLQSEFSHDNTGLEVILGAAKGTALIGGYSPLHWDFSGITLIDIAFLAGGLADDTIRGSGRADHILGRGGHDELSGGKKSDTLSGGEGNDLLSGNTGADMLHGGGGSDTLSGGAGRDILIGGKGADVYLFDSPIDAEKVDTIVRFDSDEDQIHLSIAEFDALAGTPGMPLSTEQFCANDSGTAEDADDRIIYNTTTGALYYDVDGSGDDVAKLFANLDAAPTLAAENIFLCG